MHNLPAYKALDVFWSIITLTRKIFITNDIKDGEFIFSFHATLCSKIHYQTWGI